MMRRHDFDAAFSPRPNLRGYKVDDGNSLPFQFLRDPEMEVGGIGEDGEIGLSFAGGGDKQLVFTPDARDVADDFDESGDCEVFGADDRLDTGGAQFGPGAAEKSAIGVSFAEFGDQFGGVIIARSFARGDQNRTWRARQNPE